MSSTRRGEAVAILLVYVLPVLATSVFLWSVGIKVLAVALVVVEAVIVAMVVAVRRRPAGGGRTARE